MCSKTSHAKIPSFLSLLSMNTVVPECNAQRKWRNSVTAGKNWLWTEQKQPSKHLGKPNLKCESGERVENHTAVSLIGCFILNSRFVFVAVLIAKTARIKSGYVIVLAYNVVCFRLSPCLPSHKSVSASLAPRVGGWLAYKGFSVPASLPTESSLYWALTQRIPGSHWQDTILPHTLKL